MTPKEFKHIAPILANIKGKGTGFKHPKSYFNILESTIFKSLFLSNLPNKVGYSVPNNYFEKIETCVSSKLRITMDSILEKDIPTGYFETFEDKLFKRIASEKETKIILLKKYWIPVAVAASLLLFIAIYNPFKQNNTLNIAEIEAWIEEGNLELNSYEIADLYDLETENLSFKDTIDTEVLEEYLLEEINETTFYY